MSEPQKKDNTLLIVVLAIAGFWFFSQNQNQVKPINPGPTPPPVANVDAVIVKMNRSEADGISKAFADIADKVESGSITKDKQLLEQLAPATKAARESARAEFDAFFDAGLPRKEDVLLPESAKFLRSISEAFSKEAKR
jgi:hypothetical protein